MKYLFLLLLVLGVAPLWATNYFVRADGSDSNNCLSNTSGGACLTLAHAESLASASDTINIAAGLYRMTLPVTVKAGQSFLGPVCDPVTTPGSCTAIISGSKEIGSLATFNGTNWVVTGQTQSTPVGASGITANCYTGLTGCIYPEDLFFDGVKFTHLNSGTLPTIPSGQWWFDYTNHIIYFHDNPSGHLVETSVSPAAFTASSASNVTFQYLTVEGFATPIQTGAIDPKLNGISSTNLNWVIRNSEVRTSHARGVRVWYGTQIYDSYLHDNGQTGIGGGVDSTSAQSGIILQRNVVSNNNQPPGISDQFDAGGLKFGGTRGIVMKGNTIQNNYGAGIHLDDTSSDIVIDGNLISGNLASGVYHEIGAGTASVTRNNVIKLNPREPINGTIGYQIASFDGQGIDSYCNVVEADGAVSQQVAVGIIASNRVWNSVQQLSTGNTFHHNTVILDHAGNNGRAEWMMNDAAHQPTFWTLNSVPDYNQYHLPSLTSTNFIYDNDLSGSNTALTWTQFKAKGVEPHGTADTNNASGFPTVAITSPADQSTVAAPVTLTAIASDASGITKVEFYSDWQLLATDTASPYTFTWNTAAPGAHVLAAMAYSTAGIRNCNAVTVTSSQAPPGAPTSLTVTAH